MLRRLGQPPPARCVQSRRPRLDGGRRAARRDSRRGGSHLCGSAAVRGRSSTSRGRRCHRAVPASSTINTSSKLRCHGHRRGRVRTELGLGVPRGRRSLAASTPAATADAERPRTRMPLTAQASAAAPIPGKSPVPSGPTTTATVPPSRVTARTAATRSSPSRPPRGLALSTTQRPAAPPRSSTRCSSPKVARWCSGWRSKAERPSRRHNSAGAAGSGAARATTVKCRRRVSDLLRPPEGIVGPAGLGWAAWRATSAGRARWTTWW